MKIPVSIFLCVVALLIAGPLCAAEEAGVVTAADGVEIAYELYADGHDSCIIVCPGFYNSKQNRWMRKTVDLLRDDYDVAILDFRGHGASGGKFTWSAREYRDLSAVIDLVKERGYRHLGIVGFSLGGVAALNAAAERDSIDSMVLISCPSKFSAIDFHFWEPGMFADLADNIDSGWEGKGARTGNIFLAKKDAIDAIDDLADIPILFIQGDRDWVVKPRHASKLQAAHPGPNELVIIPGGYHAERLIQFYPSRIRSLILSWFRDTLK